MKRIYWIIIFIFAAMFSNAQDNWKIKLNGKVVMAATAEDETANTKKVKAAELDKKGSLDILYKEANIRTGWKRSLMFVDENDNVLLKKDSVGSNTRLTTASIKEMIGDKKKIRIFTISLPTDPRIAATIRVRRVHLCTLELQ